MAVLNAEELNLDFVDEEASANQQDNGGIDIDDAPVVQVVNKIITAGVDDEITQRRGLRSA